MIFVPEIYEIGDLVLDAVRFNPDGHNELGIVVGTDGLNRCSAKLRYSGALYDINFPARGQGRLQGSSLERPRRRGGRR